MTFVQEAMGDADAILFVTDLFETEFSTTKVCVYKHYTSTIINNTFPDFLEISGIFPAIFPGKCYDRSTFPRISYDIAHHSNMNTCTYTHKKHGTYIVYAISRLYSTVLCPCAPSR